MKIARLILKWLVIAYFGVFLIIFAAYALPLLAGAVDPGKGFYFLATIVSGGFFLMMAAYAFLEGFGMIGAKKS